MNLLGVRNNLKEFNLQFESESVLEALVNEVKTHSQDESHSARRPDHEHITSDLKQIDSNKKGDAEREEMIDIVFQVSYKLITLLCELILIVNFIVLII